MRKFYLQFNTKPHLKVDNFDFQKATIKNELNVQLVCQPLNNPNMNVLDLGFFQAIQFLQLQECLKNIDDLVKAIEKTFDEFSSISLNHVFVILQLCMLEMIKSNDCNEYKIPHINKSWLKQERNLPT